jgi:hypothetical protein
MNKKKGCLIGGLGCGGVLFLLLVIFVIICIFADEDSEYKTTNLNIPDLRDYYTQLKGDGTDTATVMVYMIGSDLETEDGAASSDIQEMLDARADNINIVIQTGGAEEWENENIGDGVTERHAVVNGNLTRVMELGSTPMSVSSSLTDFIKWSAENYPADRYELILWNHGGGTVLGYGYDELYSEDMMTISDIGDALRNSNVKFDIVGFDACLMGTIETAYMLEPYADYMIASEEYEPSTGWYYMNWLKSLSDNTSKSTLDLSKEIIDDYIDGPDSSFWDMNTLSVVDLREIHYVYSKLGEFMTDSERLIDNNNDYRKISDARYNAKALGDGDYDQIDIISYLNQLEDSESKSSLEESIKSAVKYTNNSAYDVCGMAMYFPYDYPEFYSDTISQTESFGYGELCEGFFSKFLNIMAGGQIDFSEEREDDYNQYSWYDSDVSVCTENYDDLEVIDKGDYYALSLTQADWETINNVSLQVYIDDGEGYIDIGYDNVCEFDDDGDLMVDFDYYWVALDGQIVPFYFEYETPSFAKEQYTYGYVPAMLNGDEQIEIMIYWDEKHTDGYVAGYRPYSEDTSISVPQKGIKQLQNGDELEFLCDYYTYDGEYDDIYLFGDEMIVNGDIDVSYEYVGDFTTNICCYLTDIYNNVFTTEMVELY